MSEENSASVPCPCHTIAPDGFHVWKTLDNLRECRDGTLTNDAGVDIVEGLRAWDYDLERVTVCIEGQPDPANEFHQHWDGWFWVTTDCGCHKLMNGSRLRVRHPHTGEPA